MKLSTTTKTLRPCTSNTSKICDITTKAHTKPSNNVKPHQQSITKQQSRYSYNLQNNSPITHANNLSKNWMDYQGFKNWEGLLDPLDENLRSEIMRYGHFVEAAYRSCNFDPSSNSYGNSMYPKNKLLREAGFAGTGYRVVKNLTATSGIQLPSWAEKGPKWISAQSSWIGYVAVCHNKMEISRLGRRDVVIALRGTATCLEWFENLRTALTPLGSEDDPGPDCEPGPMVQSGFLSLYTSNSENRPSLRTLVKDAISKVLEKYAHEPLSFTITGHSLGAALATLMAYDIKKTFQNAPLVTVVSFAGPRVGNRSFGAELERQGTKVLRIVNSDDVVTKVPGFVRDYDCKNVEEEQSFRGINSYYTAVSEWIHRVVDDMQWVYADVGCELRLSSRDSPDLSGINVVTCHELKTYLYLVNGFVSSNCPFRATARKMMMGKTFGS